MVSRARIYVPENGRAFVDDHDIDRVALAARSGDIDAYERLYRALYPKVFAFLRNQLSSVDAVEDLAAEVFTSALFSIRSFEPRFPGSFKAWLFRIARNRLADYRRRIATSPESPCSQATLASLASLASCASLASSVGDCESGSARAGEWESLVDLARAIDALPPEQRECVLLRFAADLSIREVAEAMGKSEGAVKQLQHRAIESIRCRLRDSV